MASRRRPARRVIALSREPGTEHQVGALKRFQQAWHARWVVLAVRVDLHYVVEAPARVRI